MVSQVNRTCHEASELLPTLSDLLFPRSTLTVDSVYGLLDLALLWQSILCGLLVHISWSFSSLLIKVYITEVWSGSVLGIHLCWRVVIMSYTDKHWIFFSFSQRYCFPVESMLDDRKNQCLIDALQCDQNSLVKVIFCVSVCWIKWSY